MDVFALRNELVDEYKRYVESFLDIEDADLRQRVAQEMDGGLLWPEPCIGQVFRVGGAAYQVPHSRIRDVSP